MTHRFDLIFKKPKKGDPPFNPIGTICKKTFLKDEKGNFLISPDLYSTEYEGYIDNLISELQQIKVKLRKKFLE